MKTISKKHIAKWTIEGLLIVVSVLLAFYVENIRQDRIEKKHLITSLHELKESIAVDTFAFQIIAERHIPELDTTFREILELIKNKERVNYILQALYNNDLPKYTNWTLTRMLENDELKDLDRNFKNGLWEYVMTIENVETGDRDVIYENNKKALDMIFSRLKFKDDYSKLYGLGDDQPLIRYREYRDSSIVYSDELNGYLIHNLIALQSYRYKLMHHSENAMPVIRMIDEKLKELE